jgi:translation initiation factor IF-2
MAKKSTPAKTETKQTRTPIVAVMGHVDHGKTTLLDSLRGANVVDSEAGGITQNTRAHQITTPNGNKITFIDTPGHEAFSKMRARGAEVTDFVLLVVAADDGLQPQTIESIKFAQETETPIIVAINKIDLEVKSLDRIKKELSDYGVVIEEYGGDVLTFPISGLTKKGLPELIEGIELLAEIRGLVPNKLPNANVTAAAYVLESSVDRKLGPVALCLLQAGELHGRETTITSAETFRIRALLDEFQKPVAKTVESDPFWLTGLKSPLQTGEVIYFTNNEKQVKELQAELFKPAEEVEPQEDLASAMTANDLLAQMFSQKADQDEGQAVKYLPVIIKTSTRGTLEAVMSELEKLNDDERQLKVLEASVGEITEKDVERAKVAKGIVLSFQVPPQKKVADIAKRERVLVRNYAIIYEMIEEIEIALDGMLEPLSVETEVARATIKQVFTLTNNTVIAGCEVTKGIVFRGYDVWVERKGKEIGRAKITLLRHFKDEVKEVKKGLECGIMLSPQIPDLQTGDEIVAFKVEKA